MIERIFTGTFRTKPYELCPTFPAKIVARTVLICAFGALHLFQVVIFKVRKYLGAGYWILDAGYLMLDT